LRVSAFETLGFFLLSHCSHLGSFTSHDPCHQTDDLNPCVRASCIQGKPVDEILFLYLKLPVFRRFPIFKVIQPAQTMAVAARSARTAARTVAAGESPADAAAVAKRGAQVAALFTQVGERLVPGGRFYLLLSSDSDIAYFKMLAENAGFVGTLSRSVQL